MNIKYGLILFILIGCQSNDRKTENVSELLRKSAKNPKPIDSVAAATSIAKYEKLAKQNKKETNSDTVKEVKNLAYLTDYKPDSLITFDADSAKVIFVSPDSLEIEEMKQEYDEETFYTIADDNNYYDYQAMEFMRERKIDYKSTEKRFVRLIKDSGEEIFIDTDEYEGSWGLIMFNRKDDPIIIPSIDITYGWNEMNLE